MILWVHSPTDRRSHDRELGGVSETFFRPAFRKIPTDIEVPEGAMARFDCVVTGRPNPDLYWFRDGTEVFEDRLHKIVINEDGISSLIFDATARSDSGHYTCIARNRAGEDRFEVNLNVTGRPTAHVFTVSDDTLFDINPFYFYYELSICMLFSTPVSVGKRIMFSGCSSAGFVRPFVRPDRSCYHDIS